jgi:hypothetical protein
MVFWAELGQIGAAVQNLYTAKHNGIVTIAEGTSEGESMNGWTTLTDGSCVQA